MSSKSKAQLRQLFEAKKQAQVVAKVEHKLAQVTASGDLMCRVCRSNVKHTQAFWDKHLNSPEHKATLLKLAQAAKPATAAVAANAEKTGVEGVWGSMQAEFEELREMTLSEFQALSQAEVDEFLTRVPLAKKGKLRLLYKEGMKTNTPAATPPPVAPSTSSDLPSDFFDSPSVSAPTSAPISSSASSSSINAAPSSSSSSSSTTSSSASSSAVSLPARPSSLDISSAPVSSEYFGDPDDMESSSEEEEADAPSASVPPPQQVPQQSEEPSTNGNNSELPVGFFDDKQVDKSMHQQRDFTKELAEFRQMMADTAANSRNQQIEAHKQLAVLRQHAEEQDSKDLADRLEQLKKKTAERKSAILSKKRKVAEDSDSEDDGGSDADLFDTEGLFGWRAKIALDK